MKTLSSLVIVNMLVCSCLGQPNKVGPLDSIKLPPAVRSGGKPLMQTLSHRQSTKLYSDKAIPPDMLSNLLWAAFGINRPDSGKRTVATAVNCQDIDIYVVFKQGVYLFQANEHLLKPVLAEDVRVLAATQAYAQVAPVQLVYVSDYKKMDDRFEEKKPIYAAFHAGSISQNVYLYCASSGLGAVVRDGVDREKLHQALNLRKEQVIVMAQTVGYPDH